MRKLLLTLALAVGLCPAAFAQTLVCGKSASSSGCTPLMVSDGSIAISVATNSTTQLVALNANKKIYVTAYLLQSAGTASVSFVYGTGTNCGTGTTVLTGTFAMTAQGWLAQGSGLGAILEIPIGNALCIVDSASVQISGHLSYAQY